MKINDKIINLINQSINTLKNVLTKEELNTVKTALISVHNTEISTNDAYYEITNNKSISSLEKQFKIESSFYDIGNLIAVPSRIGSTLLLETVYQEDKGTDFISYQSDVIGYVYDQVSNNM